MSLYSWTAPLAVMPENTKQSAPELLTVLACERKFGAFGSMPSLPAISKPISPAALSMLRARPAPYTSLSLRMYPALQPSSFISEARAAPWMVSFGTIRM